MCIDAIPSLVQLPLIAFHYVCVLCIHPGLCHHCIGLVDWNAEARVVFLYTSLFSGYLHTINTHASILSTIVFDWFKQPKLSGIALHCVCVLCIHPGLRHNFIVLINRSEDTRLVILDTRLFKDVYTQKATKSLSIPKLSLLVQPPKL